MVPRVHRPWLIPAGGHRFDRCRLFFRARRRLRLRRYRTDRPQRAAPRLAVSCAVFHHRRLELHHTGAVKLLPPDVSPDVADAELQAVRPGRSSLARRRDSGAPCRHAAGLFPGGNDWPAIPWWPGWQRCCSASTLSTWKPWRGSAAPPKPCLAFSRSE